MKELISSFVACGDIVIIVGLREGMLVYVVGVLIVLSSEGAVDKISSGL